MVYVDPRPSVSKVPQSAHSEKSECCQLFVSQLL